VCKEGGGRCAAGESGTVRNPSVEEVSVLSSDVPGTKMDNDEHEFDHGRSAVTEPRNAFRLSRKNFAHFVLRKNSGWLKSSSGETVENMKANMPMPARSRIK
jgi:hypothetical protein